MAAKAAIGLKGLNSQLLPKFDLEVRRFEEDVLAVHVDDLLLLGSSFYCGWHRLKVDLQCTLMISCVSGDREPV